MDDYYILFDNYTQAMSLQEMFRKEGIPSRIAPAPRAVHAELGCGVSILVTQDHIDAARACIAGGNAPYADIRALPRQINPKRDRFC